MGQKQTPLSTTIYHGTRKELGLTIEEYILADTIHKLKDNDDIGWCYASNKYLASLCGCTERNVRNLKNNLKDKGLIEKHATKHFSRTTQKWHKSVAEKVVCPVTYQRP